MSLLISPRDLPTWVPGRVLSASDGLGWKDVGHRTYRYTGLDVLIPAMDQFMIVRYRDGATPMQRRIDGRWTKTQCAPGDFSLLTRAEQSHWCWSESVDVTHTYLSESMLSRVASDILERTVAEVRLHDLLRAQDPVVTAIVDGVAIEAQRQGLGGAIYAEALALQLSVHLLRSYASVTYRDARPAGPLSPGRLRRVEEYVEAHLHEPISIEQMAAVAGLGVWTFARHFRATVGKAPHEFVLARRVDRARRLLGQGLLALKDVAAACGFADQAHMTRVFRRQLGITPARLQKTA